MPRSGFKTSYIILAVIATTLWGSACPGAKIAFEYMPPMMLSGLRFMLAGLLTLPLVLYLKVNWRKEFKQWRFMLLFAFVQSFLQYGLFYMGLNLIPGAVAAIIIGAGPLFIAIFSHFSLPNDKLNARKIFAIFLGLSGVVSISLTGDSLVGNNPHFYRGVALLISSNLIGSYTNIMVVKQKVKVSPFLLTMFANFSGGVMLFFASLFVEPTESLTHILPLEFYLTLLWLAIIPAAGFSIWYYLLAQPGVKVSELHIWKFIIPVVGVVLTWLMIEGESPNVSTVSGIIVISSAIIVLQLPTKRI